MNMSTAQSASVTLPGSMRDNIHTARPSIMKPNAFLIDSIHGPAFGSSFPAEAPTINNGAPMPMLNANSAVPPRNMSPDWPITVNVATSGGATQAVTINDDSAPMMNAPIIVPRFCWPLMPASRLCMLLGICRSYRPNMPSARTTNRPANRIRIQGWLNVAASCIPAAAAAIPAPV